MELGGFGSHSFRRRGSAVAGGADPGPMTVTEVWATVASSPPGPASRTRPYITDAARMADLVTAAAPRNPFLWRPIQRPAPELQALPFRPPPSPTRPVEFLLRDADLRRERDAISRFHAGWTGGRDCPPPLIWAALPSAACWGRSLGGRRVAPP